MSEMSVSTSMTPVRGETLTLNGLPFHYREWASPGASPGAPSLVLLHGGLGNARHWDTLAQSLADRYRVLALDQRGHGESARSPRGQYTPDLITGGFAGFVGELRLSRFPIVGFSFGGHVAYTFAAVHPNQVSRLVMVETFVPPATPANIAYLNAGRGLPEVYDDLADAVNRFAQFAPRAPAAELRHWVVSGLQQQANGHWTSRLDSCVAAVTTPGESAAPNAARGGHVAPVSASNVSNADPAWRSDGVVPTGSCESDGSGDARRPRRHEPAGGALDAPGQPERLRAGGAGLPRKRLTLRGSAPTAPHRGVGARDRIADPLSVRWRLAGGLLG